MTLPEDRTGTPATGQGNEFLLLLMALGLAVAASGVAVTMLTDSVTHLGGNIPTANLLLDYSWGLAAALVIGLGLGLAPVRSEDRMALAVAWSAKILVALVAMLHYEDYYWFLDAYGFFDEPRSVVFSELSFGTGTDNLKTLIVLLYQVFPQSYHALKVLFAFVGLLAVYVFYRAASLYVGTSDVRVFLFVALYPSVLFWSSIIGKDPIVLLGIGLYAYGVVEWYLHGKPRATFLILAGALLAVFVRAWLAPILIAPLVVTQLVTRGHIVVKLCLFFVGSSILLFSFSALLQLFAVASTADLLSSIEQTAQSFSQGGSAQDIRIDLSEPVQLLAFLPYAMFTALFRPLPGEVGNVFGILAGVENLFLLLLLARALWRSSVRDATEPVILWAILLIAFWALAYSFVSFGNLGTAARFRLQILPVFLLLLLHLGRQRPGPAVSRRSDRC
jgi:hypothetical protein